MNYSKKQVILMCKDVPDNFKLVASRTSFISDCDGNETYDIEAYKDNELIFKDKVAYIDIFSNENAKIYLYTYHNDVVPKTGFCEFDYNVNIIAKAYRDNNLDYTEYHKFRDELIKYIIEDYKKKTAHKD